MDYKELRRLAELATPGPWRIGFRAPYHHYQIFGQGRDGRDSERVCETTDAMPFDAPPDARSANAAYIAAASPSVVLALLEEIEGLKKDAERYRWLRDCEDWEQLGDIVDGTPAEKWDAAIDAAMSPQEKEEG